MGFCYPGRCFRRDCDESMEMAVEHRPGGSRAAGLLASVLGALWLFPIPEYAADGVVRLPVIDKQDIRFVALSAGGQTLEGWVRGIAQDNQGFMWFATDDGLYEYDGYTFTPYLHDPGNPNSLSSNVLNTIYKDRSGILWIGTFFTGVDRLDPARGTFTHYRHQPGVESSLSDDRVRAVYQDRSGTLWFGTGAGGLNRLDPSSGKFTHYRHNAADRASLTDDVINVVYEDRYDNLWVGTAHGLNKLDRATGRSSPFLYDPRNPHSIGSDSVSGIREDTSGILWVTSLHGDGLSALDPSTQEFTRYSFLAERPGGENVSGVVSLHADADGSLWLGTVNGGLLRLDLKRREFARYTNNPVNPLSLCGNGVGPILEDAEGVIWISTRNGACRFPRKSPGFVRYQQEVNSSPDLRGREIQSAWSDRQGYLWIGTTSGLQMLDRETGRYRLYQHDANDRHSITNAPVFAYAQDRPDRIWFGTYGAGLNRFDRATGRFTGYRHDLNNPDSLSSDRILCLLIDHDGVLWVGTENAGLNRFDPGTGRFKNYRHDAGEPHSLAEVGVQTLFEDRAGILWAGSGGWLERFDRKSEGFTGYHSDPKDPGSLSNAQVETIYEDRRGTLWIGTRAGLNRMQPSGTFTKFTEKDGLLDPFVKAILEDRHGDLWLATHSGVSHFSPQTGQFRSYFESDGLLSNNLYLMGNEAGQTPSGEMVFGSSKGLTVFDPDRLSPNSYVPPVVLTDFLLFNKPVHPDANSPLQKPISATSALTLSHNQSIFTLEFAALSYVDPEKNRYRFRMEGLEKEWNEVDSKRRLATYTNLAPAKYVFRVQGSNNDQVWNDAGVRLAITVLPPWWGTWYFRSALVLFTVGLLFMAHRIRMRGLRLTAARLERQVAERTRELMAAKDVAEAANRAKSSFLSHMSHELRTPLNAILGFANLLREDAASERQRADLDIIHRSGEHLLGLIDDVLDVARIETGRETVEIASCDLIRLIHDVTDMIRVRASEKNLELLLVQSPGFPQAVATDAAKLRQMLINLLGNAVKSTERGSVTLRLDAQRTADPVQVLLSFEVEDTGIGIAREDQKRIFEPFVQVGRTRQKGTGLGLAITRQFADMLGGTIQVTSAPGKGSLFRLEVPAKCEQSMPGPAGVEREYILDAGQPEYRILVVDDSPENRQLLQRLLVKAGFQVRIGEDGAQAVEAFQSWRPQFIWMDLRMPEVDGAEAARRIRALNGGSEVKIAAVTASEHTHAAVGMDDLVHKPYRSNEIFECMARHLNVRYRAEAVVLAPAVVSPATLRPETLAKLPDDLLADLKNAVVSLDVKRITAVITRVSERDAVLASALAFHADRSAFTKIWEVLKDCKSVQS